MDGLGLALFGIFLVSFTISTPVNHNDKSAESSFESSESNELSSSEEVTVLRTTLKPIELSTMGPDGPGNNLHQVIETTPHPPLEQTTSHPSLTEQEVVEPVMNISIVPLEPFVPVTGGTVTGRPVTETPGINVSELQLYTVALTSPEEKPVRGDNI
ncbi:uncharacterized protein LOC113072764 [Carassius auratus]|uniref:Gsp-37 protein n=1 Tax=Carassius auratus TaxID=7957 RepID=D6RU89_CARAU|nr:uncharacterized protein LOC113072764 [Carassius auratus]BAJ09457.1 gsp-37 [Carassius auratus]